MLIPPGYKGPGAHSFTARQAEEGFSCFTAKKEIENSCRKRIRELGLVYYVLFLSWPTIHNIYIYRVMYFMLLSLIRFASLPSALFD